MPQNSIEEDIDRLFRRSKVDYDESKRNLRLQVAANERATEAREASNGRIQALEETSKYRAGLAMALLDYKFETNERVRQLEDKNVQSASQINQLNDLVKNLTNRLNFIESREANSTKCSLCAEIIRPRKSKHKLCEDCFSSKKSKTCSSCYCSFMPVHSSYKKCPACYKHKTALTTKSKQS